MQSAFLVGKIQEGNNMRYIWAITQAAFIVLKVAGEMQDWSWTEIFIPSYAYAGWIVFCFLLWAAAYAFASFMAKRERKKMESKIQHWGQRYED